MAKRAKAKARGRPRAKAAGKPTDARLLAAAAKEFNQRGFDGTDTNRIARRAGFAPQTFYRWFRDKTAVFLAVYRVWEQEERAMLSKLTDRDASASAFVDAVLKHHKAHRVFRRSFRTLALESSAVRKARTESRKGQIEQIKSSGAPTTNAEIAPILLQIERLAEAAGEGEFADLGVEDKSVRAALTELQTRLRN